MKKKKIENVSKFFWNFFFFRIFITWIRNPWHGGVDIPYRKSWLQGFEKIYVGRLFSGYLKYLLSWGFWGRGWPLKRLKWQKPLGMGWVWLKWTPSTTIGWISQFSRGCHCTSLKKKTPAKSLNYLWFGSSNSLDSSQLLSLGSSLATLNTTNWFS